MKGLLTPYRFKQITGLLLSLIGIVMSFSSFAQSSENDKNKIYSLDVVNDLLDTERENTKEITSVQTFGEKDALPENSIFAVEILTKNQLRGLGPISIPEALRAIPGVLVKQLSTGVYEVHLQADRGIYSNGNPITVQNVPFLLMVDFEPVDIAYNHQIAWENLPTSIAEVAQIEVFKSSQPVWYGSQAVAGVIHIIRDTDPTRNLNLRLGNQRNLHADVKLPIGQSESFKAVVGGHFNYSDKPENEFYAWNQERYVVTDSALLFQPNAELTNLFSKQSIRAFGGNLKLNYAPTKDFYIDFNSNVSISEANLSWLYIDQISETRRNINRYAGSINGRMKELFFRVFYKNELIDLAEGYSGFAFQTQTLSANLNYNFSISENVKLVPHLSFRQDSYKNRTFEADKIDTTYGLPFAGNANRQSIAGGLSTAINPSEKVKLFGGVHAEQSNLVDDLLIGFQANSLVQFKAQQQLRLSLSRTAIQPNLEAWSVNRSFVDQMGVNKEYIAGQNLRAATFNQLDLSFETPLYKILTLKTSAFYSQLNDPIVQQLTDNAGTQTLQMANHEGNITQFGATVSSSIGTDNFMLDVHATWVNTQLSTEFENEGEGAYTPNLYGGVSMLTNFMSDRFQVAATLYFGLENDQMIPKWQESLQIAPNLSVRANYKVWQESSIFFEMKEFGNQDNFQNPFASKIPTRFLFGGSLVF